MNASTPSAMIMAGGTGGHVYPGLAVAEDLRAKGWNVSWIGTSRGLEASVVPANNFTLHTLKTLGLRGKGLMSKIKGLITLVLASAQAFILLARKRPNMVIGFGGYAAGPAGAVAKVLGIPLLIHEQNAVAGTTNRLLAKHARRVMAGFDGAFLRDINVSVTGNPLRAAFSGLPNKRYPDTHFEHSRCLRVAILGGSQGAQALNAGCPAAFASLPDDALSRIEVRHQCGKAHQIPTEAAWKEVAVNRIEVMPFVDDMPALYAWADVAICRAGALTVSELAVTATPSILVPLPQAIDDHQQKNAEALSKVGGAVIVPQAELAGDHLLTFIVEILDDATRLERMSEQARYWSKPDATQQVVAIAQEVVCG